MTFGVNTGPLTGTEGKPLQSRELKARLDKEAQKNVAMRFADTDQPDVFEVSGCGVLHLSVLIEDMRRRGQRAPGRSAAGDLLRAMSTATASSPSRLAVIDAA